MNDLLLGGFTWLLQRGVEVLWLAVPVWLVDRSFRHRLWPEFRESLWWAVALTLCLPSWVPVWSGLSLESVGVDAGLAGASRSVGASLRSGNLSTAELPSLGVLLAWVWIVGVFLGLVRLGVGAWRVRSALAWRAERPGTELRAALARAAARAGLMRAPRLRVDPGVTGPSVVGVFRPCIVVPKESSARAARDASLELALLHECVHLARRDLLRGAAFELVRLVHWFHPLAHALARRGHAARELACDRRVAELLGAERGRYRETVAAAARELLARPPRRAAPGVAFITPGSMIAERLRALGRELRVPRAVRKITALCCATCALSCSLSLARAVLPTPMHDKALELLETADQPGCLQLRYAVLGAMAEAASSASEDLRESSR